MLRLEHFDGPSRWTTKKIKLCCWPWCSFLHQCEWHLTTISTWNNLSIALASKMTTADIPTAAVALWSKAEQGYSLIIRITSGKGCHGDLMNMPPCNSSGSNMYRLVSFPHPHRWVGLSFWLRSWRCLPSAQLDMEVTFTWLLIYLENGIVADRTG